jgi:hypothetical protein
METPKPEITEIHYRFALRSGRAHEFDIRLRADDLSLIPPPRAELPDWTRLEFHQCACCPLDPATSPRCPVAVSILELVDAFQDCLSYEDVDVAIRTESRTYSKTTTLQQGLSSLMGIYNVTSGCPVLNKLRPMVGTHLPFATIDETVYRMISMYLLAQFFRRRKGLEPDWELSSLVKLLREVLSVDIDFASRLRSISMKDANLNALTILSQIGDMTEMTITDNDLARLEKIFLAHYS